MNGSLPASARSFGQPPDIIKAQGGRLRFPALPPALAYSKTPATCLDDFCRWRVVNTANGINPPRGPSSVAFKHNLGGWLRRAARDGEAGAAEAVAERGGADATIMAAFGRAVEHPECNPCHDRF